MLINRDKGVEPVTMCLICLRPAPNMAVDSIVTPFWLIEMNTLRSTSFVNNVFFFFFYSIQSWHPGLAKMAKKYSRKCVWEHGNPPNTTPFSHVGQNLAYGSGIKISPMYLVTLWYREKTFYDITTDECQRNAVCGHYTQVSNQEIE